MGCQYGPSYDYCGKRTHNRRPKGQPENSHTAMTLMLPLIAGIIFGYVVVPKAMAIRGRRQIDQMLQKVTEEK